MRFRRTKDELARGLTPEQAKIERKQRYPLGSPDPDQLNILAEIIDDEVVSKKLRKAAKNLEMPNGEITIRIRPDKNVDSDYFEHLGDQVIEVSQDNDFYKWIDHLLEKIYNEHGDAKLFQDVLNEGFGRVLTTRLFTKDVK